MNIAPRITIAAACFSLCVFGVITSSRECIQGGWEDALSEGAQLRDGYIYAATDASLKLSLNQIESIIRHHTGAKPLPGKMEFGPVTVEHGAVVAQVVYREDNGGIQAFIYKLKHKNSSWYVAEAQKLWFVPRSILLRGLQV